MNVPNDEQRRLITELLRQKPFECNRVFFFLLQHGRPEPLDEDSRRLYRRDQKIVDALPRCEALEDWAGNIINGPREEAHAHFYASYRFDHLMVVVSKIVDVSSDQTRVDSPFNKYFVDAFAAIIGPVVRQMTSREAISAKRTPREGKGTTRFRELVAWRQCKCLWREKYGADVWIAIKGTQPIATARTIEELDEKVCALHVEPPLLYAPPEGVDESFDILSTSGERQQARTQGYTR